MVCYLKIKGNEKPPLGLFVMDLWLIPVCTGNITSRWYFRVRFPVYPCVYREHVPSAGSPFIVSGLSLCIQGTLFFKQDFELIRRFIPVHTGNITWAGILPSPRPVYPCAYREHFILTFFNFVKRGLSLCIQGTYIGGFLVVVPFRFIPVHTGNIKPIVAYVHGMAVYPCAYREHRHKFALVFLPTGLSLCIQGTFLSLLFLWIYVRFIPVHTGNMHQDRYLQTV